MKKVLVGVAASLIIANLAQIGYLGVSEFIDLEYGKPYWFYHKDWYWSVAGFLVVMAFYASALLSAWRKLRTPRQDSSILPLRVFYLWWRQVELAAERGLRVARAGGHADGNSGTSHARDQGRPSAAPETWIGDWVLAMMSTVLFFSAAFEALRELSSGGDEITLSSLSTIYTGLWPLFAGMAAIAMLTRYGAGGYTRPVRPALLWVFAKGKIAYSKAVGRAHDLERELRSHDGP